VREQESGRKIRRHLYCAAAHCGGNDAGHPGWDIMENRALVMRGLVLVRHALEGGSRSRARESASGSREDVSQAKLSRS
jgi:hypothetical protein